jgi:hypothetical protein
MDETGDVPPLPPAFDGLRPAMTENGMEASHSFSANPSTVP